MKPKRLAFLVLLGLWGLLARAGDSTIMYSGYQRLQLYPIGDRRGIDVDRDGTNDFATFANVISDLAILSTVHSFYILAEDLQMARASCPDSVLPVWAFSPTRFLRNLRPTAGGNSGRHGL